MDLLPPNSPAETVAAYVWTIDRRDWDAYAQLFGDTVYIDYKPSPGLPKGERIAASEWVGGAETTFNAIPTTHHMLVPVRITLEGDTEARVIANCVARHFDPKMEPSVFTQYMRYDFGLTREAADELWIIDSVIARIEHQDGNAKMLSKG